MSLQLWVKGTASMKWSVAIFSSRETVDVLSKAIAAVLNAARGDVELSVDILVNGNRRLADEAGRLIDLSPSNVSKLSIRVWFISLADKAHAWNQYLCDVWPGSDISFFIDGYVQIEPDALMRISDGLAAAPHALAASGIPTIGWSAKTLQKNSGMHGNLYAIKGDVVTQLRTICFRLPLGLYRTDPVVGAVICFGLNPAKYNWDASRVLIQQDATWWFQPLRWWSVRDLRVHLKRMMRQAQGVLETVAIREHLAVRRKAPQHLPKTAAELIFGWIEAFPRRAAATFIRKPLSSLAALRLKYSHRDWSETKIPPLIIAYKDLTLFGSDSVLQSPPKSAPSF